MLSKNSDDKLWKQKNPKIIDILQYLTYKKKKNPADRGQQARENP